MQTSAYAPTNATDGGEVVHVMSIPRVDSILLSVSVAPACTDLAWMAIAMSPARPSLPATSMLALAADDDYEMIMWIQSLAERVVNKMAGVREVVLTMPSMSQQQRADLKLSVEAAIFAHVKKNAGGVSGASNSNDFAQSGR